MLARNRYLQAWIDAGAPILECSCEIMTILTLQDRE